MSLVKVTYPSVNRADLEIQRPEALNALNQEVLEELQKALLDLKPVKVLVITGSGEKAFVAGADIKAMKEMTASEARAFSALGQGVFRLIQDSPFIAIAGVNGFALGGGLELALSCDLIYATPGSKFALPEINLGLVPGFGGTYQLYGRVGFHYAMEMMTSGKMISAEEAHRRGLILDLLSSENWRAELGEKADFIASKGKESLAAVKSLLRANANEDRDRALERERESFGKLFDSSEPQEGISAFLEKRKPQF
jgi:enoyl-CoA hydratase